MKNSTSTTKTSHKKAPQKHIVNALKKDNGTRKVKKQRPQIFTDESIF